MGSIRVWSTGADQQQMQLPQPTHTHPCAQPPPHFPNWHSCSSVMEKLDLSGDIVSRAYPNIASVVHWGPAAAAVIHSKPPHIDIHMYIPTWAI